MAIEIEIKKKQFLIPESGDPCDLWRAYFTKLKKEVGHENAKMIWLVTWSKNGDVSCTTNADFNRFLQKNQIDVSGAATRAVADVSAIGGNILGLGKNLTKVLSVGVPVALTVVLLLILIMLFNTARKADATDLAMLTPAGRAAKLAGGSKLLGR